MCVRIALVASQVNRSADAGSEKFRIAEGRVRHGPCQRRARTATDR
jgi:hypothetical protein